MSNVVRIHELKQTVEISLEQGWYGEKELREDLGWSSSHVSV